MGTPAITAPPGALSRTGSLARKLNRAWHEPALKIFIFIVLAHWAEHLAQAYEIWALGWPTPEARGVVGLWFPWLVTSETLHYGYALIMLVGLWTLRKGFVGRSYVWWMVSFGIQFWHHIEHALLAGQVVVGQNLFGSPVPMSIIQFWIPRVELHLVYNTLVFIPMVIGMYYHLFPPTEEDVSRHCTCAVKPYSFAA